MTNDYRGGVAPLAIAGIPGGPFVDVEPHPPEQPREAMSARPNRTPGPMSYRVPTDGSSYQMKLGWTARSVEIVNSSTQVLTLTNDMGDAINCGAGGVVVVPTMPSFMWTAQLQGGPSTNNRAAYLFFFPYYRPTLSGSLAGGSAVTVTNFPASQPVTFAGPVAVSNFPASQAVTSVDGGLVTVGNTADAAQTGAAGSVVAQLKGLFLRIVAAGDAVAGAVGMLATGLWDGTNTTRQRAVGTAGAGLGVALAVPPNGQSVAVQGAGNAAVTITLAAVPGQRNHLRGMAASFSAPSTVASNLQVTDNAVQVWLNQLTLGGTSFAPYYFGENGIANALVNTPLAVTQLAGGVGIATILSVTFWVG